MPCFTNIFFFDIILILSLCCLSAKTAKHPSAETDNTVYLDKLKLITLAEELVRDAKLKQRQIHKVRNSRNTFLAYDIGLVLGKIREKYKRMMDIYREAYDRKNQRTVMMPPGVRIYKAMHWIISMELVHVMEVDIDKLVHVLESIPKARLESEGKDRDPTGGATGDTQPSPTSAPPATSVAAPAAPGADVKPPDRRASDNITEILLKPKFLAEEELKQYYREQYNARSGHNANWTLDEYYGVI